MNKLLVTVPCDKGAARPSGALGLQMLTLEYECYGDRKGRDGKTMREIIGLAGPGAKRTLENTPESLPPLDGGCPKVCKGSKMLWAGSICVFQCVL